MTMNPQELMLPDRLRRLPELATDLWWTWNTQAREVFRRMDYTLWRQTAHNPVLMLRNTSPEMLAVLARDDEFLRIYDDAIDALDRARSARDTWWQRHYGHPGPIAYFSAEFALHQSLPIYAGGLGVLAGDHCKEASDLGLPLVGVGFMYPQGYFHQSMSLEGWQQEIILGIGGVRVLRALGYQPVVWHLNEGHTAFVTLERISQLLERGASFEAALEEVRHSTIFTTHTPVAAGHDAFPMDLVEAYLAGHGGSVGPYRDAFLQLGRYDSGSGPMFNMTALAIRSAGATNAVSQVHGQVTREMWAAMWPSIPESRRPVNTVTNGIHVPTWIAADMARLFERHLTKAWRRAPDD